MTLSILAARPGQPRGPIQRRPAGRVHPQGRGNKPYTVVFPPLPVKSRPIPRTACTRIPQARPAARIATLILPR